MNALIASVIARCLVASTTVISCCVMFVNGVDWPFVLFIAANGTMLTLLVPKYEYRRAVDDQ